LAKKSLCKNRTKQSRITGQLKRLFLKKTTDPIFKESTIKNAGKGLLAKQKIKEGEFLPNYWRDGSQRWYRQINALIFSTLSKFAANVKRKGNLVDMGDYAIVPLGYAGIVNHDRTKTQNVEIRYVGDEHPQKSIHAGKAVYWLIRAMSKKTKKFSGNYGIMSFGTDVSKKFTKSY
jgi:hypothetical protein